MVHLRLSSLPPYLTLSIFPSAPYSDGNGGKEICQALSNLAARSCTSHCAGQVRKSFRAFSQAASDPNHRSFAPWVCLIHHLTNGPRVQLCGDIKCSLTHTVGGSHQGGAAVLSGAPSATGGLGVAGGAYGTTSRWPAFAAASVRAPGAPPPPLNWACPCPRSPPRRGRQGPRPGVGSAHGHAQGIRCPHCACLLWVDGLGESSQGRRALCPLKCRYSASAWCHRIPPCTTPPWPTGWRGRGD